MCVCVCVYSYVMRCMQLLRSERDMETIAWKVEIVSGFVPENPERVNDVVRTEISGIIRRWAPSHVSSNQWSQDIYKNLMKVYTFTLDITWIKWSLLV